MEPGTDLLFLSGSDWRELQAAAAELDLIHGGYFRARGDAIQFFCSPDNAPEGWSQGFPDGNPELPRACVGAAEVVSREQEGPVALRLAVSNWGAVQRVQQAYRRGEYQGRFREYVADQEAALRGRTEERVWLRQQFARLRAHARGELLQDR